MTLEGFQGGEGVLMEFNGAAAVLATPLAVGVFVCACGAAGTGVLVFPLVGAAAPATAVESEGYKGWEEVLVECMGAAAAFVTSPAVGALLCVGDTDV